MAARVDPNSFGMNRDIWSIPPIEIELVDDRSATAGPEAGFLRLRRLRLRNRHSGGGESEVYDYDIVERDALDAVVLVLADLGVAGPRVCLRSSLRPPLAFRDRVSVPFPPDGRATLWELPAGLIERDERGEEGVLDCASREALEETGFELDRARFERLGPSVYLSPGVLAEQIHFLFASVDPASRGMPIEDGSPVEAGASVRFFPLAEAQAACADGRIADAKTELGIRRLTARLRERADGSPG